MIGYRLSAGKAQKNGKTQYVDNQRIMTAERKHRYCRVKAMLLQGKSIDIAR